MVDLVIPEDFCHNDVEPTGKTSHSDGENKHFIWVMDVLMAQHSQTMK